MTDREKILAALPDATAEGLPPTEWTGARSHVFADVFLALGGKIGTVSDFSDLVAGRSVWLDDDARQELQSRGIELPSNCDSIWDAAVGVTLAQLLVAETGTIAVAAGPGHWRLASLVPPVHVVLARRDQEVPSLSDAIAALTDRTSVFISGTSRTADIEGVMVRGVHGPGEVWLLWL